MEWRFWSQKFSKKYSFPVLSAASSMQDPSGLAPLARNFLTQS